MRRTPRVKNSRKTRKILQKGAATCAGDLTDFTGNTASMWSFVTTLPSTAFIIGVIGTGFCIVWRGTQNAVSYKFTYTDSNTYAPSTLTPVTPPISPSSPNGQTYAMFYGITPGLAMNDIRITARGCNNATLIGSLGNLTLSAPTISLQPSCLYSYNSCGACSIDIVPWLNTMFYPDSSSTWLPLTTPNLTESSTTALYKQDPGIDKCSIGNRGTFNFTIQTRDYTGLPRCHSQVWYKLIPSSQADLVGPSYVTVSTNDTRRIQDGVINFFAFFPFLNGFTKTSFLSFSGINFSLPDTIYSPGTYKVYILVTSFPYNSFPIFWSDKGFILNVGTVTFEHPTVVAPPTKPVLTLSTTPNPASNNFTISWTGGTGTGTLTTAFTVSPSGPTTTDTSSPASFTGAAPNTTYSITAITRSTTSCPSETSAPLSVTTVPAAPVLNSSATNILSDRFTIGWTEPIENATAIHTYRLNGLFPSTPTTTSGKSVTFYGLADDTDYTVKIVARKAGLQSLESAPVHVRTRMTSAKLQASSAEQIFASSAQDKRTRASGAATRKEGLLIELDDLRAKMQELIKLTKRRNARFPVTTSFYQVIPDGATLVSETNMANQAYASAMKELIAINLIIAQTTPGYEDPLMQTVVPDAKLATIGHTKKYDVLYGKFIYYNSAGAVVPNPFPPPAVS